MHLLWKPRAWPTDVHTNDFPWEDDMVKWFSFEGLSGRFSAGTGCAHRRRAGAE